MNFFINYNMINVIINNDFKVSSMEQSQTGIYMLSNYLLLVSECGIWKSSRFGQYRKLHEGVMLDQLTNSAQPHWPTYFRGLYLACIIYKLHRAKPGIKELSIRPGWTFVSLLVKGQVETMRSKSGIVLCLVHGHSGRVFVALIFIVKDKKTTTYQR